MTDKYLLVKVYDDWADEISTEGFFTTTQEELDETYEAIKEYFKNPNKTKYEANIRNFNLSRYRFSEIENQ